MKPEPCLLPGADSSESATDLQTVMTEKIHILSSCTSLYFEFCNLIFFTIAVPVLQLMCQQFNFCTNVIICPLFFQILRYFILGILCHDFYQNKITTESFVQRFVFSQCGKKIQNNVIIFNDMYQTQHIQTVSEKKRISVVQKF